MIQNMTSVMFVLNFSSSLEISLKKKKIAKINSQANEQTDK